MRARQPTARDDRRTALALADALVSEGDELAAEIRQREDAAAFWRAVAVRAQARVNRIGTPAGAGDRQER